MPPLIHVPFTALGCALFGTSSVQFILKYFVYFSAIVSDF